MAKKNSTEDAALHRLAIYQSVFGTPEGQEVLQDLMHVHYIMKPTFNIDPTTTAHREGERNAVLRILSILNMSITQLRERIKNDTKIRDGETAV